MCPRFPHRLDLPSLTLALESDSLLDTRLVDTKTASPVFALSTSENRTVLSRCDIYGSTELPTNVIWPTSLGPRDSKATSPVATVRLDGRELTSDVLLKKGLMDNSPKFRLRTNKSYNLKWKRVDGVYQCTLCRFACTSHTPIATYEPKMGRISLYSKTAIKCGMDQPLYAGIPEQLLQYIIITVMLLSTRFDAWREVVNTPIFDAPPMVSPMTAVSPIANPWTSWNCSQEQLSPISPSTRRSTQTFTPFLTPLSPTLCTLNPQKVDLFNEITYAPISLSLSPPSSPRTSSSTAPTPTTPKAEIPMDFDFYSCSRRTSQSFEAMRRRSSMPSLHNERFKTTPDNNSLPPLPRLIIERPPLPTRSLTERRVSRTLRDVVPELPPSYSEFEWTERPRARRRSEL